MLGLLRNRCLRRGGTLFSNNSNTCTYNLSSIINHRYVFSFLQVSHIGDYFTTRGMYVSEDEEVEGHETKKSITNGDTINLHDLLFTKNRDYLVRYQDNQQVKAEHLAAKVILIYFSPMSETHLLRDYVPMLENVYNELYPQNGFEVVFVAFKDEVDQNHVRYRECCKKHEEIFSLRPWISIPLSDIPSENCLQRRGVLQTTEYHTPGVLIVDSSGMVLQCHETYYILELYGAAGYPFSDERIKYLQSEDDAISLHPSLQTLLATPQRDYVIKNNGEKVPIHTLKDKVVALYFYDDAFPDYSYLKKAYKKLKKNNENFEVVLIYTREYFTYYRTTEESFWKTFKTMPWLAIPFNDPIETKLKRILEYSLPYMHPDIDTDPDQVTRLVIFGPHGEFIEPFGANILKEFGIKAYPFTTAKLVELEIEKVNNMKLEMLLWVSFSKLAGKNVIAFTESYGLDNYKIEFLKMLKERYIQCQGTHDEFEVIHISQKEEGVSKHIGYLPWVVSEFLPLGYWNIFNVHCSSSSAFIFFNGDGRVVRKTIWPSFESIDFPFCADGLEKEAWAHLDVRLDWKSWYGSKVPCLGRPRIYSLEKMNAPAGLRVHKF